MREVLDLLVSLGRTNEAGVVAYRQAVNTSNLKIRSRNLKQTLAPTGRVILMQTWWWSRST